MNFYPTVKENISPSGLDAWHHSRGGFVKSYFIGEKFKGNASTISGKKIHALIQNGLLEVKHRFSNNELTLIENLDTKYGVVKVLGIPDSFENATAEETSFVDYKSGKENNWDGHKLATDLKMMTTAWLVWKNTGMPKKVKGYIEYIPTQWNPVTREIEPTEGESVVAAEFTYTYEELDNYTAFILKTIDEVNEAYIEWLDSTDMYVNQEDIAEYAILEQQVTELEAKMKDIKDRIAEQMSLGKKDSLPTPFGSFYFTTRKTFEYPKGMRINYLDYGLTIEDAEEIAVATTAVKKRFELDNEPVNVSKSLGFKPKKVKK
jgi:hypothetical protein